MWFKFLLVVHVIISIAMVGVILIQRSEGGGLTGGSPSGLMSARGAANFLTRATTILATLFVALSITLAGMATFSRAPGTIDQSLAKKKGALDQAGPAVAGEPSNATAPIVPTVDAATAGGTVKVEGEKSPAALGAAPAKPVDKKLIGTPDPKAESKPLPRAVSKPVVKPVNVPTEVFTPPAAQQTPPVKVPDGLIPTTNPQ
jgi:preprotein translocase subunit SecG